MTSSNYPLDERVPDQAAPNDRIVCLYLLSKIEEKVPEIFGGNKSKAVSGLSVELHIEYFVPSTTKQQIGPQLVSAFTFPVLLVVVSARQSILLRH